jgi:cysteine desulfurase/selenocysteine lyase
MPTESGLPAETNLIAGQAPKPTDTPTVSPPTPGVALAGARVPGSPTVPDWDPSALTMLVERVANDLFAALSSAPSVTADPTAPAAAGPAGLPAPAQSPAQPPAAPTQAAAPEPPVAAQAPMGPPGSNATTQAPAAVPSAPTGSASPFDAPLDWGQLDGLVPAPIGAFPLIDTTPQEPAVPSAPYWIEPASEPARAPAPEWAPPHELLPTEGVALRSLAGTPFDAHAIRREFPILQERVNGKRLVWLDNAATTQKPQAVIDRLSTFYTHENSNIHRAAHTLAARATDAYEAARESVRRFVGAPSARDIVFVRGTTEGINLVAQGWGRRHVAAGDEVVISWLEHHANIVPWQMLCSEKGARLRVAPVDDSGQVILEEYEKLLGPKTRIVAFSQVSNALGTITPAREMIELAHRYGAKVLLDGAQSVSHMQVDVQALDCDFFVFSGHKVFAPTGIGVVFGKGQVLEAMPAWQGGGNMIKDVTFERTTYQEPPARFEAGTGNIADAIGLGTALDWLSRIGMANVDAYEHELLVYATERLATVPGLTMIGTAPAKAGVLSFILAGQKTEEVGGLLDQEGIAVRSGHHCAQPILRRFGLEATVRASLALYNICEDIDALVAALHRLQAGQHVLK